MVNNERFATFDGFPGLIKHTKWVDQDSYFIRQKKGLLGASGVSSCLVVTIYNLQRVNGALAHVSGSRKVPLKLQPDQIVDTLLHDLHIPRNSDFQCLEASLSGENGVYRSSPAVRAKLNYYGIRIIGEDLCDAPGRLVFLDCGTGRVEVYRA